MFIFTCSVCNISRSFKSNVGLKRPMKFCRDCWKKQDFKSSTRLHHIWCGMLARCNNPNVKAYKYYGGKGIRVCKEWLNFDNFKIWADNNGYKENLTIERKNNSFDYSPENCTWILQSNQSRNTTRTKLTLEKAKNIRKLSSTKIAVKELASLYNVSIEVIRCVLRNETWKE